MVALFTMRTHNIRHFDLLKAFGYIERVVKSDFFRKKILFISYVRNVKEQPSNIKTMG